MKKMKSTIKLYFFFQIFDFKMIFRCGLVTTITHYPSAPVQCALYWEQSVFLFQDSEQVLLRVEKNDIV